jgi:hypothetical protein
MNWLYKQCHDKTPDISMFRTCILPNTLWPLLPSELMYLYMIMIDTVKPPHEVTSIKQSPVLKGHLFSCPVIEHFI